MSTSPAENLSLEGQGFDTKPQNVLGAVIFFGYILFALLFIGLITSDVRSLYSRSAYHQASAVTHKSSRPAPSPWQLYILTAMCPLSFSTLSYHMLSFLIQSYTTWSCTNSLRLPTSLLKPNELVENVHVWRWATHSTLFQDFARDLCTESSCFWWTKYALVYSLSWNVVMIVQGTVHGIPELWKYFVLEQILPVSFTQNLFLLALHLRLRRDQVPQQQQQGQPRYYPTRTSIQLLIPVLYTASMLSTVITAQNSNSPYFMSSLLLTRLLLFTPYIVLAPEVTKQQGSKKWLAESQAVPVSSLMMNYAVAWATPLGLALNVSFDTASPLVDFNKNVVTSIGYSAFWARLWEDGRLEFDHTMWVALGRALFDSSAVATLGWDLVIGVLSLAVSWWII